MIGCQRCVLFGKINIYIHDCDVLTPLTRYKYLSISAELHAKIWLNEISFGISSVPTPVKDLFLS
jgi:hypothetical protein